MRILVTGASGFIGSWLCERLFVEGNEVVGVDDMSTGTPANVVCLPALDLHVHDAGDERLMAPLITEADFVFHLAATVGVFQYIQKSVHTILNNIETTATVLRLCNRYQVPFLLTSTSEVYGKTNKLPFAEDDDIVLGPSSKWRWGYAAGKYADEMLALGYYRQYGLPVRIVRLFNVVGPRQTGRYGMVVPRFVQQAKAGQPMTVFDTGEQTRTFCSVYDIVDGLTAIAGCKEAVGEVVNLGSEEEISIKVLADEVLKVTNRWRLHAWDSEATIRWMSYAEAYGEGFDETPRRVPDCSKARRLIGWKPKRSLTDILAEIVEEKDA